MDMKTGKILCLVGAVFGLAGIFAPALTAAFVIGGAWLYGADWRGKR